MPSVHRFLKFVAALLLWAVAAAAWADPPGRVGRIADLQGTVWIYDAEQGEWIGAQRNRPLTSGDRLAAEGDARAELHIGSITVRMGVGADLQFLQLDDQSVRLHLENGGIAARLRTPGTAGEFVVETAEGRFTPAGAGHFRIDRDRDEEVSAATSWEGAMRFESNDSELAIPQGQRAEFWKEAGVTHYDWASSPQDALADWAISSDRQESQTMSATRYVSPEMTGWEDLDRYGQWDQHAEYGSVWIPAQVAPGWAPYRYGQWAWMSPWGWTWVDDAPWGFAPFHYGRWFWWRERWCWTPGSYVTRPAYAPALVGWVGGPQISVGVTIGSRPHAPLVGWVPLGPREVYHPPYSISPGHWRAINPHAPWQTRPRQEPAMFVNRGMPGGVTVVPVDVIRQRRPIGRAVVPFDPRDARQLAPQAGAAPEPPAFAGRRFPPSGIAGGPSPVAPAVSRSEPGGGSWRRHGGGGAPQVTTPGAVAQPDVRGAGRVWGTQQDQGRPNRWGGAPEVGGRPGWQAGGAAPSSGADAERPRRWRGRGEPPNASIMPVVPGAAAIPARPDVARIPPPQMRVPSPAVAQPALPQQPAVVGPAFRGRHEEGRAQPEVPRPGPQVVAPVRPSPGAVGVAPAVVAPVIPQPSVRPDGGRQPGGGRGGEGGEGRRHIPHDPQRGEHGRAM
ncbi:MAG TPA: DUF6600 domain-containing protein [Burkholderiaceae bacterium]|nr:DUF6600 domain-containing protein [Burkholderiaceae bacterium]